MSQQSKSKPLRRSFDSWKPAIRIVTENGCKSAVCDGGYGSGATASFIRHETPLLASDIARGRNLWAAMKRNHQAPSVEAIFRNCPTLEHLGTPGDIAYYVADAGNRTPLKAAAEIVSRYFPGYKEGAIERMARHMSRHKPEE